MAKYHELTNLMHDKRRDIKTQKYMILILNSGFNISHKCCPNMGKKLREKDFEKYI